MQNAARRTPKGCLRRRTQHAGNRKSSSGMLKLWEKQKVKRNYEPIWNVFKILNKSSTFLLAFLFNNLYFKAIFNKRNDKLNK